MSPYDVAKSGSEDAEQAALFCWAVEQSRVEGYAMLEHMFAIPNGGSRGSSKAHAMAVGARLKATGVKAGVSDIFLPFPRHNCNGLFIEMKCAPEHGGSKKDESALQAKFGKAVQGYGFGYVVCCGWEEARDILLQYLSS